MPLTLPTFSQNVPIKRNTPSTKERNVYLFTVTTIPDKCGSDSAPVKRPAGGPPIAVRTRPGDRTRGILSVADRSFACALGRSGVTARKREGDGATPLGIMHPLHVLYRADRRLPALARTRLDATPIQAGMGWCDAPGDRNYNRPVRLPYPASHEEMLRKDGLYDVCVVLDWNLRRRRRGHGSAIFLHLARPGMTPTEGCIAVSRRDMNLLLPLLSRETRIRVLH